MFVAQWGVLMQHKNRYRMTPGVRHSGIVNWLIYLFIYLSIFVHISKGALEKLKHTGIICFAWKFTITDNFVHIGRVVFE